MKTERNMLIAITVIGIIAFLAAYANCFFQLGKQASIVDRIPWESTISLLEEPIYYLVLVGISLFLVFYLSYSKCPYIVMSILCSITVIIAWILFGVGKTDHNISGYFIAMTILSITMSILYISLVLRIIMTDRRLEKKKDK